MIVLHDAMLKCIDRRSFSLAVVDEWIFRIILIPISRRRMNSEFFWHELSLCSLILTLCKIPSTYISCEFIQFFKISDLLFVYIMNNVHTNIRQLTYNYLNKLNQFIKWTKLSLQNLYNLMWNSDHRLTDLRQQHRILFLLFRIQIHERYHIWLFSKRSPSWGWRGRRWK